MRDPPLGYLDALVDAKASTWGAYKHRLDGARPADEVLDREPSTNEELREFERKARKYGEAVDEAMEREETAVEAMIKDTMRMMQEEDGKGADLSSWALPHSCGRCNRSSGSIREQKAHEMDKRINPGKKNVVWRPCRKCRGHHACPLNRRNRR